MSILRERADDVLARFFKPSRDNPGHKPNVAPALGYVLSDGCEGVVFCRFVPADDSVLMAVFANARSVLMARAVDVLTEYLGNVNVSYAQDDSGPYLSVTQTGRL